MIIADENLHDFLVKIMLDNGYEVRNVALLQRGAPDDAVIEMAHGVSAILVTEDKDFGELVFAHQITKNHCHFLALSACRIANHCKESITGN